MTCHIKIYALLLYDAEELQEMLCEFWEINSYLFDNKMHLYIHLKNIKFILIIRYI